MRAASRKRGPRPSEAALAGAASVHTVTTVTTVTTVMRELGCAAAPQGPPEKGRHALPGCPQEKGRHALPAEVARAGSAARLRAVIAEVATERACTKDAAMVGLSEDYSIFGAAPQRRIRRTWTPTPRPWRSGTQ